MKLRADGHAMRSLAASELKLIEKLGDFLRDRSEHAGFVGLDAYVGEAVDEQLFKLRRSRSNVAMDARAHPLPVQAHYVDSDGQPVFIWIFCSDNGDLAEIEFWKPSGKPIQLSPFDASVAVGPVVGRVA